VAERSDEALMLAYKAGDVGAFEVLVRRYRTGVFSFLLRFAGNRQRAEDAFQETWLRVIKGAPNYVPSARFTTWLFAIARNLCMDLMAKESLRRAEPLDELGTGEEGHGAHVTSSALAPDDAAHGAVVRPLLARALEQLPPEQREVFLLRELMGMTFTEIAEITGVSDNTAKSRFRYAIGSLRKHLAVLKAPSDGRKPQEERAGT